jgi:hypothetical protein
MTDADIKTMNKFIIQVKSNRGNGLGPQMERTAAAAPDHEVIGYGPELGRGVIQDVQKRGFRVTRSKAELMRIVKP